MKKVLKIIQEFILGTLLNLGLALVYFIVIGLTAIFTKILRPQIMRQVKPTAQTFWQTAEDYKPDLVYAERQS